MLHDAIKQVRQKHAGLKGVHMTQVISDASKIIGSARAVSRHLFLVLVTH